MIKIFVSMLATLLLALAAQAANPPKTTSLDLCICQTGDAPANQIKYFKMGCKTWLNSHSCREKLTTDIKTALGSSLANRNNVRTVKIGYVGHWASATETVTYLKNKVTAAISKFGLQHVDIDNTACLSNDNPYEVIRYFRNIDRNTAAKINVRGNQVNSSGMWDPLLPGKTNFWAVANGENLQAAFPNCKAFRGKRCYAKFQKADTGICYNDTSKKYERLTCQKKSIGYAWLPNTNFTLEIAKHTNKTLNKVTFGFAGLEAGDLTVLYISDEIPSFSFMLLQTTLLPLISTARLAQLTELAKIYGRPLEPIIKSHQKTFMPEIFEVSEADSQYILQTFETEEEANIYVTKAYQDPRYQLFEASVRD